MLLPLSRSIKSLRKYYHTRLNKKRFWLASLGFGLFLISLVILATHPDSLTASVAKSKQIEIGAFEVPPLDKQYGFIFNDYDIHQDTIQSGDVLSEILGKYGVSFAEIDAIDKVARNTLEDRLPALRPNKPYTILADKTTGKAQYFIYAPSVYFYVVYDLTEEMKVYRHDHPVERKIANSSGVISSSLWQAMADSDLDYSLISRMEGALQWSVDFYHIQKNDRFKLIYEKEYIEGEEVGVGKLLGAYFQHYDKGYYAYYFKNKNYEGFYDEEGRPTKKSFLKAPVKFARISSRYNLRRFHPVLKRVKPHLGTDYAAPTGTPILATADGTITKATRSRGNGNYVKIKHDKVYETQYLHMSKFGKGIRPGVRVSQGQVIGYVGATGLATGPHVCYRFWKHGKQIDPRTENMPPPEPLPDADLAEFKKATLEMKTQLEAINFKEPNEDKEP